jgi:predicted HTH transcriptional regulator
MNSEYIEGILFKIEESITTDKFIDVERSIVELKDLSQGSDWKSLKETICAFLNTSGGIVICGIQEKNKKYYHTGFNRDNESKIIELQSNCFKNDADKYVDLSDNIKFDYKDFLDGEVVIIIVYSLSQDNKFVKVNNNYYERKLTQDKKITEDKLRHQREYKVEIENSKETTIISQASIDDLSLDKINHYVSLLNKEIKNETLKPDLEKAKSFLLRSHFINQANEVTTLGMLVCGEDPFTFLESRAEVNCYYDTSTDIGKDKKLFRNDVINLMDETFRYIWGHIKINRTIKEGGRSEPEYPEKLIRETINNALAHRDYTINNFVSVTIEPNRYIEIKNPGSFKEKIKLINTNTDIGIRRLIAGIPDSKNPKLANVLKVYDKIESQGRGMASLVNAALENLIDLPTYEIRQETISLKIPTGQLVDESIETWLKGFNSYITKKLKSELTFEHKAVLAYFYKSELANRKRLFAILLTESNNHYEIIEALKQAKLIFEHEAGTETNPVYVLDRTLMQTDFKDEMMNIFGDDYIHFSPEAREILNIVYLFTKFNNETLKAAEITPEVYRRINGREIVGKKYESLGRKVRALCKKFEHDGIFNKGVKSDYSFNFNHKAKEGLFN